MRAQLAAAKFTEKQRATQFFLRQNNEWQMDVWTRRVDQENERRRREEDDKHNAVIRRAETCREGLKAREIKHLKAITSPISYPYPSDLTLHITQRRRLWDCCESTCHAMPQVDKCER